MDHANQQSKYQFCYHENNPYSLTVTKKPQMIYNSLYKQGTYLWIIQDTKQLQYQEQQILQMAQLEKIKFLKTVDDLQKQYGQHKGNIVVICHISLLSQVENIVGSMIKEHIIKCLIFYGNQRIIPKLKDQISWVNHSYVDSEQAAIKQIRENKKYYTTGEFVNFISLDKQKWNSNILVKTMFGMIKQKTNLQQIMMQFKQSALLCFGEQHKPDIQQLVKQYQTTDHLEGNKAVGWYSRESFLYKFINSVLRISKDPTCLFIIQPFFQDLFNNIKNLYQLQQEKGEEIYRTFTCYRGAEISENEIKFYKLNKDSFIQNLGFLSTSRSEYEANNFVKNALFLIQVDDDQRKPQLDYGFADIDDYTLQEECQILFNPLNSFKIVDFEQCENQKYKITLKYGQMARVSACQDKKLSQKQLSFKWFGEHQIRESQLCINMSNVLIQDCYSMESSRQYCNKVIEITNKSQNYIEKVDGHYLKSKLSNSKGDYKTMQIQLTKCLEIYEQNCCYNEDKNQKYAKILNDLGETFDNLAQYEKAIQFYQRSLKIKRQTLGENHPNYATTLSNLGSTFDNLGQYEKAIQFYQRSQKIKRQTLGENHPSYAITLNNLGSTFKNMQQYEKAVQFYQRSEKINRLTLGEYHPEYGTTLNNLGLTFYNMGQYEKAVENLERCSQIDRLTLGEYHPEYAKTLNNFGVIFQNMGQYEKAIKYLETCEKIWRQTLGENHPNYVKALSNLGLTFKKMQQYEKAVQFYQRCEKLNRLTLGEYHPEYAKTLSSLGLTFYNMGQYEKAVENFKKYQKIRRQNLGENHPDYKVTLNNLTQLYSKMNISEKSFDQQNKSENEKKEDIIQYKEQSLEEVGIDKDNEVV